MWVFKRNIEHDNAMKIKKYGSILFILLGISACDLEEVIYNDPLSASFIRNESDAVFQLNGVYNFFTTFVGYKSNLMYPLLYGGDDIVANGSVQRPFADRTVPSTNQYHLTPWSTYYSTINNANGLMQSMQRTTEVSETTKRRFTGELHFLRAFSYFNLVRFYGGVPIRQEPTTGRSDFYPARNTVDEVYQLIFADLKKASESCLRYSIQPAGEFGRATKGSAQGLLALAYLTYGNQQDLQGKPSRTYYEAARLYADSVILSNEYQLLPDYASLWDVDQEKNAYREVIYGIQLTRDTQAASASSRGSELPFYLQPATRNGICGNVTNGLGSGTLRVQPWFYDQYRQGEYANDYRTEVAFLTTWRNTLTNVTYITYPRVRTANEVAEPFPYIDKYKDPKGLQARNNENDFFVMRLAELFLIKAEVENELDGPTPAAYQAFNRLRERARRANGTARTTPLNLAPGLTKEEFRMKIFNERGLELVGEGHRWFDAVRMRHVDNKRPVVQYRYEDFYPAMSLKTAPSYSATTNTWQGGRVQPQHIVPFSQKFILWAIPSSEIDANPSIVQNPGW